MYLQNHFVFMYFHIKNILEKINTKYNFGFVLLRQSFSVAPVGLEHAV